MKVFLPPSRTEAGWTLLFVWQPPLRLTSYVISRIITTTTTATHPATQLSGQHGRPRNGKKRRLICKLERLSSRVRFVIGCSVRQRTLIGRWTDGPARAKGNRICLDQLYRLLLPLMLLVGLTINSLAGESIAGGQASA